MANDIPRISTGPRTPITSAGGSGGGGLGNIRYETSTTPDLTGAGATIGALMALMGRKDTATNKKTTPKTDQVKDQNTPKEVKDQNTPKEVKDTTDSSGDGEIGGGYLTKEEQDLLRDYYETSGSSYVSPFNNPWTGSTPTGLGTFIGGGGTGTVGGIKYPPGTTQSMIDKDMGTTNGQSNAVIAGVNMTTGEVIAQPNYMIGPDWDKMRGIDYETTLGWGDSLPSDFGSDFETTLGWGDGTDVSGINMSTGETIFSPDFSIGPNFGGTDFYNADDYFSGAGDLGSFGGSETITAPYDFSNELSPDQMNNLLPTIDVADFDISNLFDGDFFDSFTPSFDTSSFDIGSLFGDVSDYLPSFSDYFDFGNLFAKDGGLATPMYAHGGQVKGYADGGSTVTDLLAGGGIGALIGALLSGQNAGQISQGVDMSKIGVIQPRTTTFGMGPAKYVPYSEYSTQGTPAFDYDRLNQNLGTGTNPMVNQDMARAISPLAQQMPVQVNQPMTPAPQLAPTAMPTAMPLASPLVAPTMPTALPPLQGMEDRPRRRRRQSYTYGNRVNPAAVLSGNPTGMKDGGLPKATTPMTPEGRHDYRQGAYVDGIGDGQSDDIPAMLADGEYVIDADTVAALGNGSNKAGAKVLDGMRHAIRDHKRSAKTDKIPPKAKSPLEYMRMGAKMKGTK